MRTVLLVDDEPIILRLLGPVLQRAGLKVLVARNGREALEIFEKSRDQVDLLVSDVVMPEMDGFALARRVIAARPEVPILFISAVVQQADIPGIRQAIDCRFLRKPFLPKVLVATVEDILGGAARATA